VIRAVLARLVAVLVIFTGAAVQRSPAHAAPVAPAVVAAAVATAPEPPQTPITVNDFLPDDQNISDCLGALERPGCGSKERGGWRQTIVFGVMIAGLAAVFGRIAFAVYRNRR
jgi:hypothetical protein